MLCCTPLMSRMWTPSNFCSRLTSSSPARKTSRSVTSLGSVTPGAATEGVTPLFFLKNLATFFLLIAVTITIAFYCFHSGTSPPPGCHSTTFLPVRPRFSTILCIFAHKFFFLRVSPPGGCHPGRSAPLAPPSDATAPGQ